MIVDLKAIGSEHDLIDTLLRRMAAVGIEERHWLLGDLMFRTRSHFLEEEDTFRRFDHPALRRLLSGHESIWLLMDQARDRLTRDPPEAAARRIALLREAFEGAMLMEVAALRTVARL